MIYRKLKKCSSRDTWWPSVWRAWVAIVKTTCIRIKKIHLQKYGHLFYVIGDILELRKWLSISHSEDIQCPILPAASSVAIVVPEHHGAYIALDDTRIIPSLSMWSNLSWHLRVIISGLHRGTTVGARRLPLHVGHSPGNTSHNGMNSLPESVWISAPFLLRHTANWPISR